MKIVFTGGGSGGHFYPIISIVEEMRDIIKEQHMVTPKIYFLAPSPYNRGILFDNSIIYRKIYAGKIRRYFSLLNFTDGIKTFIGILKAFMTVFWIYPDIIFSKGGYGSFPVVFAGKILGIPIMIHESDSHMGKANKWASKFAKKIAISYPDAAQGLPKEKVAWTGNPIRKEVRMKATEGAHNFLEFDPSVQTLLILGGSQGAQKINDAILDSLETLVEKYQIIHQTGKNNFKAVDQTSKLILDTSPNYRRYKSYPYMNDLAIRMSAGAADLIITRAGSTLFEIANWGIPSIVIPIPPEISHDQKINAYNYARSGAATVIEEDNLTPEILTAEINRILSDRSKQESMKESAKAFSKQNAGRKIAEEILELVINHGK